MYNPSDKPMIVEALQRALRAVSKPVVIEVSSAFCREAEASYWLPHDMAEFAEFFESAALYNPELYDETMEAAEGNPETAGIFTYGFCRLWGCRGLRYWTLNEYVDFLGGDIAEWLEFYLENAGSSDLLDMQAELETNLGCPREFTEAFGIEYCTLLLNEYYGTDFQALAESFLAS